MRHNCNADATQQMELELTNLGTAARVDVRGVLECVGEHNVPPWALRTSFVSITAW
jgi:hypothetical protein